MIDVGPVSVSVPDLIRVFTVGAFAAVAVRDVRTRRVPSIYWTPLTLLGIGLLLVDAQRAADLGGFDWRAFLVPVALGLGVVVPLAYGFWWIGGFGGADARALLTIALLYPVYPEILVGNTFYPVEISPLPVFSLTILANAVICGVCYPFGIAFRNLRYGYVGPRMFVGIGVAVGDLPTTYGKLLEQRSHSGVVDRLKTAFVPRRRGLDLDALRMYLRWRGLSLEELRDDPERYRDPESLPAEPNPPTDGAIETDGGEPVDASTPAESEHETDYEDPWGANAFLEETDAYGTTPETLRYGLDHIVASDQVTVSPGIPFLVPVFFGLVVSFVYGDIVSGLLGVLGLL